MTGNEERLQSQAMPCCEGMEVTSIGRKRRITIYDYSTTPEMEETSITKEEGRLSTGKQRVNEGIDHDCGIASPQGL